MPVILPATSDLNFTPSSTALSGPPSTVPGTVLLGQSVTDVACALIVMLNNLLTFCTGFPASVTFTVKLNVPAVVGVPLIAPLVALIANPVGRPPAVIDQLNGVV